jgi:tetratricopeptide (TPR) repeat protein
MRTIVTALLAAFALAASASAQTAPNPVLEHFRAYRAAFAQGDLATADTAAAAALAASEARDGDGGRTAVLALNLASLRLERGDRDGALAPATRAHTLATTRADTSVDTRLSRLIHARAALSERDASKDELKSALDNAQSNPDLGGDLYLAAIDLGRREMADERFTQAAAAWAIASAHADHAPSAPIIARADALVLEAVALIYQASSRRPTFREGDDEFTADTRLREARALLLPLIVARAPGEGLTTASRSFATMLAWRGALDARLNGSPRRVREPEAPDDPYFCPVGLRPDRMPIYPLTASNRFQVGSVVIFFRLGANGEVIHREVAAAAPPSGDFSAAVTRVLDGWTLIRSPPLAPCQQRDYGFQVVNFTMPD